MKRLKTAGLLFFVLTLITGIVYPLLMTGLGQIFFSGQAQGSLIYREGVPIGSVHIGQSFTENRYFWPRPSVIEPPYLGAVSGGSQLAASNPALIEQADKYAHMLRQADPQHQPLIPVDLVTQSASGLDPHISIAAARYQVPRVALARNLPPEKVQQLIDHLAEYPWLGIIGEPRVNVLLLNLSLDQLTASNQHGKTPQPGRTP